MENEIEVSWFPTLKKPNLVRSIKLKDLLQTLSQVNNDVESIRKIVDEKERKESKKLLPLVCFGGTFTERKVTGLIKASGLCQFEFDNCKSVDDANHLKMLLGKLPFVYVACLSVSSLGVFCLVKFDSIVDDASYKVAFSRLRLEVNRQPYTTLGSFDDSIKDISRGRFATYDTTIIVNKDATTLTLHGAVPTIPFHEEQHNNTLHEEQQVPLPLNGDVTPLPFHGDQQRPAGIYEDHSPNPHGASSNNIVTLNDDSYVTITRPQWFDSFLKTSYMVDRLNDYDTWVKFGMALHASGCTLNDFIQVSMRSQKFDAKECEKKWNSFSMRSGGITIGTLEYLVRLWGFMQGNATLSKQTKALLYLTQSYVFVKNSILNSYEYKLYNTTNKYEVVNDDVLSNFNNRISQNCGVDLSNQQIAIIIKGHCQELNLAYNPIVDKIAKLPLCCDTDIFKRFCMAIGDKDCLHEIMVTKWFIGAVGRILSTSSGVMNTANDLMLIFRGKQGIGKTRLVKHIASLHDKHYVATWSSMIDSKDFKEIQHTKAIIFFDEINFAKHSTLETLKTLMSSTEATYRKAYDIHHNVYPIVCSYLAATNEERFLVDTTGNRRFYIIDVEMLDLSILPTSMELWGYAKYLFDSGYSPFLSIEEVDSLNKQNEMYTQQPQWIDFFESIIDKNGEKLFLAASTLILFINNHMNYRGVIDRSSIIKELKNNGILPIKKKVNGKAQHGYPIPFAPNYVQSVRDFTIIAQQSAFEDIVMIDEALINENESNFTEKQK